jgi:hypothetical protein
MSRDNIEAAEIRDCIFGKGNRDASLAATLAGIFTMTAAMPRLLFLDPGGGARDVLMPPEVLGARYIIVNTADAAEVLTFKDDTGVTTIGAATQNETAYLVSNGTSWFITVGVA